MNPLPTARLVLRPWRDADRAPFAAMSADRETMTFLMPLPTRAESDAWIDRHIAHQAEHGFCLWAVQHRSSGDFMGAVGLYRIDYEAHFTPAIEIGWRLARPFWGAGYAPEAAAAALRFGFDQLRLPQVVATAAASHARSQSVMARIGMSRDPADDFDYPRLPPGHPMRLHVLYRISQPQWRAAHPAG